VPNLTKWHCSNYTSAEFAAVLGGLGIRQSVGRTGSCFDNALAESLNAAVKVERVQRNVYRAMSSPAFFIVGLR
jgi:transposase InsO family protein